jgi:hypothetical protein
MIVYHREVLRTPLRTLEAEIGISRSAVDKFHRQRSHPGKNWPKLRDWYIQMRQNRAREEYQTPPQLLVDSAVLLMSQMPYSKRVDAVRMLAESLRTIHAELKEPQPEWVRLLADSLEGDESS